MQYQYVTKMYRQRTSMVTSVPKAMVEELGLKRGDFLMWTVDTMSDEVKVCKVRPRRKSNDGAKGNIGKQD